MVGQNGLYYQEPAGRLDIPETKWSGELPAWEELARLDQAEVCKRAKVSYDPPSATFYVPVFSSKVLVKTPQRELTG